MLASSTARTAAGAGLLLASAASAIPLNLNCVQASYLALADPELSTCVATEALGSVLPLFFGASNLSLTPVLDTYLEAYCPAPACNTSTVATAVGNVDQSCGDLFENIGLTNQTLSFLVNNEPIFKSAICTPTNATASNSTGMSNSTAFPAANSSAASSSMSNGAAASNETSFSFCLPSLMSSFEAVTGQNVTVQLLAGLVTGNTSFASFFPSLNSSATNATDLANATSLGNNETLSTAVCTDCIRQMYLRLETGFANSTEASNATAASNVTLSLLSIVKAGAEAICGQDFFGSSNSSSANATMPEMASSTSLVMPTPIPVSTRSVNMVTGAATTAVSSLASAAPSAVASSAISSGVASPVSSAIAAAPPVESTAAVASAAVGSSAAVGDVVSSPASAASGAASAIVSAIPSVGVNV